MCFIELKHFFYKINKKIFFIDILYFIIIFISKSTNPDKIKNNFNYLKFV